METLTIPHLNEAYFPAIRNRFAGRYTIMAVLREATGPVVFRTDKGLVSKPCEMSIKRHRQVQRAVMSGRKQVAPERASGRELLRQHGIISFDEAADKASRTPTGSDGLPICDYNVAFCLACPDCVVYGATDAASSSHKSREVVCDAWSIRVMHQLEEKHQGNALYDHGTLNRHGVVSSKFIEHRMLRAGSLFLSFQVLRDLPVDLTLFALRNLAVTSRYGATPTRQGEMDNQVIGIIQADAEKPFSNLRLVQRVTDLLVDQGMLPEDLDEPVDLPLSPAAVRAAAVEVLQETVAKPREPVTVHTAVFDPDQLDAILAAVPRGDAVGPWLKRARQQCQTYFEQTVQKRNPEKKDKGKDNGAGE